MFVDVCQTLNSFIEKNHEMMGFDVCLFVLKVLTSQWAELVLPVKRNRALDIFLDSL